MEEGVLASLWGANRNLFVGVVEPLIGSVAGPGARKHLQGCFEARHVRELRAKFRFNIDEA